MTEEQRSGAGRKVHYAEAEPDRPGFFAVNHYLEAETAMKTALLIAYAILSLYAISDVLKSARDWATKVVLIAIILIPFVGAGLYLFAFRDKRSS